MNELTTISVAVIDSLSKKRARVERRGALDLEPDGEDESGVRYRRHRFGRTASSFSSRKQFLPAASTGLGGSDEMRQSRRSGDHQRGVPTAVSSRRRVPSREGLERARVREEKSAHLVRRGAGSRRRPKLARPGQQWQQRPAERERRYGLLLIAYISNSSFETTLFAAGSVSSPSSAASR